MTTIQKLIEGAGYKTQAFFAKDAHPNASGFLSVVIKKSEIANFIFDLMEEYNSYLSDEIKNYSSGQEAAASVKIHTTHLLNPLRTISFLEDSVSEKYIGDSVTTYTIIYFKTMYYQKYKNES